MAPRAGRDDSASWLHDGRAPGKAGVPRTSGDAYSPMLKAAGRRACAGERRRRSRARPAPRRILRRRDRRTSRRRGQLQRDLPGYRSTRSPAPDSTGIWFARSFGVGRAGCRWARFWRFWATTRPRPSSTRRGGRAPETPRPNSVTVSGGSFAAAALAELDSNAATRRETVDQAGSPFGGPREAALVDLRGRRAQGRWIEGSSRSSLFRWWNNHYLFGPFPWASVQQIYSVHRSTTESPMNILPDQPGARRRSPPPAWPAASSRGSGRRPGRRPGRSATSARRIPVLDRRKRWAPSSRLVPAHFGQAARGPGRPP